LDILDLLALLLFFSTIQHKQILQILIFFFFLLDLLLSRFIQIDLLFESDGDCGYNDLEWKYE